MLFPFSWKGRERSPIKIIERTHEIATQALYVGSEGAIQRRHLLEKDPITKRCDELGLRWRKEFSENGAAAFEQQARPNHSAEQERVAYLGKKIARGSRRSTPSGIGSWSRPGNNGRFVRSGLRDTLWGHCARSPLHDQNRRSFAKTTSAVRAFSVK